MIATALAIAYLFAQVVFVYGIAFDVKSERMASLTLLALILLGTLLACYTVASNE